MLFENLKRVQQHNEMAIGDCVLAKISKNDDQSVDDNDINVDNQKYFQNSYYDTANNYDSFMKICVTLSCALVSLQ